MTIVRVLAVVGCLALTSAVPTVARAQSYHSYGDGWVVACDNVRRCTMLGLAPEDESDGYVAVTRDGERGALPSVMFAVESDGKPRDRKLLVTLHGTNGVATPVGPLDAIGDGVVARATIHGRLASLFLSALLDARTLSIRLTDAAASDESSDISLRGAPRALRAIDAQQRREGPVPRVPSYVALPIRAIAAPPGTHPRLVSGADPICGSFGDLWFSLGSGARLRGECVEGGAYNFAFRFFILAPGAPPRAATFDVPWRSPHDQRTLTNPSLSDGGRVLSAFAKGIGVGTCGEASDWIWNGRAFTLVRLAQLDECRGVSSDDWPVLYRARLSGGGT